MMPWHRVARNITAKDNVTVGCCNIMVMHKVQYCNIMAQQKVTKRT